jgi:Molybdopterin-binding domain of aldehyde dehydrogenase
VKSRSRLSRAALYEEVIYDERGQVTTGSLADYLVASACEIPPMLVVHLESESPTTLGGFRGMGEGGTIGAPAAVANAVGELHQRARHAIGDIAGAGREHEGAVDVLIEGKIAVHLRRGRYKQNQQSTSLNHPSPRHKPPCAGCC